VSLQNLRLVIKDTSLVAQVNFNEGLELGWMANLGFQVTRVNETCVKGRVRYLNNAFENGYIWLTASRLHNSASVLSVSITGSSDEALCRWNGNLKPLKQSESLDILVDGVSHKDYSLRLASTPFSISESTQIMLPEMKVVPNSMSASLYVNLSCSHCTFSNGGNLVSMEHFTTEMANEQLSSILYHSKPGYIGRDTIVLGVSKGELKKVFTMDVYTTVNAFSSFKVQCPEIAAEFLYASATALFFEPVFIGKNENANMTIVVSVNPGAGMLEIADDRIDHTAFEATIKGTMSQVNQLIQDVYFRALRLGRTDVAVRGFMSLNPDKYYSCTLGVKVIHEETKSVTLNEAARILSWKTGSFLEGISATVVGGSLDAVYVEFSLSKGEVDLLEFEIFSNEAYTKAHCTLDDLSYLFSHIELVINDESRNNGDLTYLSIRIIDAVSMQTIDEHGYAVMVETDSQVIDIVSPVRILLNEHGESSLGEVDLVAKNQNTNVMMLFLTPDGNLSFPVFLSPVLKLQTPSSYIVGPIVTSMMGRAMKQMIYKQFSQLDGSVIQISISSLNGDLLGTKLLTVASARDVAVNIQVPNDILTVTEGSYVDLYGAVLTSSQESIWLNISCEFGRLEITNYVGDYNLECTNKNAMITCHGTVIGLNSMLERLRYYSVSVQNGVDSVLFAAHNLEGGQVSVPILTQAAVQLPAFKLGTEVEFHVVEAELEKVYEVPISLKNRINGEVTVKIAVNSSHGVLFTDVKGVDSFQQDFHNTLSINGSYRFVNYVLKGLFYRISRPLNMAPVMFSATLEWSGELVSAQLVVPVVPPLEINRAVGLRFRRNCTVYQPLEIVFGETTLMNIAQPLLNFESWFETPENKINITVVSKKSLLAFGVTGQDSSNDSLEIEATSLEHAQELMGQISVVTHDLYWSELELPSEDTIEVFISFFGFPARAFRSGACNIKLIPTSPSYNVATNDQVRLVHHDILLLAEADFMPSSSVGSGTVLLHVTAFEGTLDLPLSIALTTGVSVSRLNPQDIILKSRIGFTPLKECIRHLRYSRKTSKWFGSDNVTVHVNNQKALTIFIDVLRPALHLWLTDFALGYFDYTYQSMDMEAGNHLSLGNISVAVDNVFELSTVPHSLSVTCVDVGMLWMNEEITQSYIVHAETKMRLLVIDQLPTLPEYQYESQIVSTTANVEYAVQTIVVSDASDTNTIDGEFTVSFNDKKSLSMSHDVTETDMVALLENIPGLGHVEVTRTATAGSVAPDSFTWTITFFNVESSSLLLVETSQFASVSTEITVFQISHPNVIAGSFTLMLLGQETARISWDATAAQVEEALNGVWHVENKVTVEDVYGSDSTFGKRSWRVMYTMLGNWPELQVLSNFLSGNGAMVEVVQEVEGSPVTWGWFVVKNGPTRISAPIENDASAIVLMDALLSIGVSLDGQISKSTLDDAIVWAIPSTDPFQVEVLFGTFEHTIRVIAASKEITFQNVLLSNISTALTSMMYFGDSTTRTSNSIAFRLVNENSGSRYDDQMIIDLFKKEMLPQQEIRVKFQRLVIPVDFVLPTRLIDAIQIQSVDNDAPVRVSLEIAGTGGVRMPKEMGVFIRDGWQALETSERLSDSHSISSATKLVFYAPLRVAADALRHLVYVPAMNTVDWRNAAGDTFSVHVRERSFLSSKRWTVETSLSGGDITGDFRIEAILNDGISETSVVSTAVAFDASAGDIEDAFTSNPTWPNHIVLHATENGIARGMMIWTITAYHFEGSDMSLDFINLYDSSLIGSDARYSAIVDVRRSSEDFRDDEALIKCPGNTLLSLTMSEFEIETLFKLHTGTEITVQSKGDGWRFTVLPLGYSFPNEFLCTSLNPRFQAITRHDFIAVPIEVVSLHVKINNDSQYSLELPVTYSPNVENPHTIQLINHQNEPVVYENPVNIGGTFELIARTSVDNSSVKCTATTRFKESQAEFPQVGSNSIAADSISEVSTMIQSLRYTTTLSGVVDVVTMDCKLVYYPFIRTSATATVLCTERAAVDTSVHAPKQLSIKSQQMVPLGNIFELQVSDSSAKISLMVTCANGALSTTSMLQEGSESIVQIDANVSELQSFLNATIYVPPRFLGQRNSADWIIVCVDGVIHRQIPVSVELDSFLLIRSDCGQTCVLKTPNDTPISMGSLGITLESEGYCADGEIKVTITAQVGEISSISLQADSVLVFLVNEHDAATLIDSLTYHPKSTFGGRDKVTITAMCMSSITGYSLEVDVDVSFTKSPPEFVIAESCISVEAGESYIPLSASVKHNNEDDILTLQISCSQGMLRGRVDGTALLEGDPWSGSSALKVQGKVGAINNLLSSIQLVPPVSSFWKFHGLIHIHFSIADNHSNSVSGSLDLRIIDTISNQYPIIALAENSRVELEIDSVKYPWNNITLSAPSSFEKNSLYRVFVSCQVGLLHLEIQEKKSSRFFHDSGLSVDRSQFLSFETTGIAAAQDLIRTIRYDAEPVIAQGLFPMQYSIPDKISIAVHIASDHQQHPHAESMQDIYIRIPVEKIIPELGFEVPRISAKLPVALPRLQTANRNIGFKTESLEFFLKIEFKHGDFKFGSGFRLDNRSVRILRNETRVVELSGRVKELLDAVRKLEIVHVESPFAELLAGITIDQVPYKMETSLQVEADHSHSLVSISSEDSVIEVTPVTPLKLSLVALEAATQLILVELSTTAGSFQVDCHQENDCYESVNTTGHLVLTTIGSQVNRILNEIVFIPPADMDSQMINVEAKMGMSAISTSLFVLKKSPIESGLEIRPREYQYSACRNSRVELGEIQIRGLSSSTNITITLLGGISVHANSKSGLFVSGQDTRVLSIAGNLEAVNKGISSLVVEVGTQDAMITFSNSTATVEIQVSTCNSFTAVFKPLNEDFVSLKPGETWFINTELSSTYDERTPCVLTVASLYGQVTAQGEDQSRFRTLASLPNSLVLGASVPATHVLLSGASDKMKLVYTPAFGYCGWDEIKVELNVNASDSFQIIPIRISCGDEQPLLQTSLEPKQTQENTPLTICIMKITDAYSTRAGCHVEEDMVRLKVLTSTGTLEPHVFPGISVDSTTGDFVACSSRMNQLEFNFIPQGSGDVTLTMMLWRNSKIVSAVHTVNQTITVHPVVEYPSLVLGEENLSPSVIQGGSLDLSQFYRGIELSMGTGTSTSHTVHITSDHGMFEIVEHFDLLVSKIASGLSVEGTMTRLNHALQHLIYHQVGAFIGSDSIKFDVIDSSGVPTTISTLKILVAGVSRVPVIGLTDQPKHFALEASDSQVILDGQFDVDEEASTLLRLVVESSTQSAQPEVQEIKMERSPVSHTYQVNLAVSSNSTGTFRLALGSKTTTAIHRDALASVSAEIGASLGESMESKVLELVAGMEIDVQVMRSSSDDGFVWTIQFERVPRNFPELSIDSFDSNEIESLSIDFVESYGSTDSSSFSIQLGYRQTYPLDVDASALEVKRALEYLPTVSFVDVTKHVDDNDRTSGWSVTFFRPSGDVPLMLIGDLNSTGPIGFKVSEVQNGFGSTSITKISSGAIHRNAKQLIRISADAGTLSGSFVLGIDLASIGGTLAVTNRIDHNAVASIDEEFTSHDPSNGFGMSMESLLNVMLVQASEGIQTKYNSQGTIHVKVSKTNQVCDYSCDKHLGLSAEPPLCSHNSHCDMCVGRCQSIDGEMKLKECVGDYQCDLGEACGWISGQCLSNGEPCQQTSDCVGSGSCSEQNCVIDPSGGFTWEVEFVNAPWNLPLLFVEQNKLVAGANAVASADILFDRRLTPVFKTIPNALTGSFIVDGMLLPFNASPLEVLSALNCSTEEIIVLRSLPDNQNGFDWYVINSPTNLSVDGSLLIGEGAYVFAESYLASTRPDKSKLTLRYPYGVSVEQTSSTKLKILGTADKLKNVLRQGGLYFQPDPEWTGNLSVQLTASKFDGTLSTIVGSFKVTRPPAQPELVLSLSNDIVAREDTRGKLFPPNFIRILGAPNLHLSMNIECKHGSLSLAISSTTMFKSVIPYERMDVAVGPFLTLYGTLTEVQEALEYVIYKPHRDFNGVDELSVTLLSESKRSKRRTLFVNVLPLKDRSYLSLLKEEVSVEEDGLLNFGTAFDVSDSDSDMIEFEVRATFGDVTLTQGSLLQERRFGFLKLLATIQDLKAVILPNLQYKPLKFFSGRDIIVVTANSTLSFSGSSIRIPVHVTSVNNVPIVSLARSDPIEIQEDSVIALSGLVDVEDYDIRPVYEVNVSVQTVRTYATHVNMVQVIRVTADSGDLGGDFRVSLDLTSIGGSLGVSRSIRHNAIASVAEESTSHSPQDDHGQSMQSILDEMIGDAAMATDYEISVRVERVAEICDRACRVHSPELLLTSSQCSIHQHCSLCVGHCEASNLLRCASDNDCSSSSCVFGAGECLSTGTSCASSATCQGSCESSNCFDDPSGGYTWRITFLNAPYQLPMMSVHENGLSNAVNPTVSIDLIANRSPALPLVDSNQLGGVLSIGDVLVPFDSSASSLEYELSKVVDVPLIVSRSESDLEGGYTWQITFVTYLNMSLPVTSAGLTGVGAGAKSSISRIISHPDFIIDVELRASVGGFKFGIDAITDVLRLSFDSSTTFQSAVAGILYQPPLNWNSIANKEFVVIDILASDSHLTTGEGTLLIHVVSVNDSPVIQLPGQTLDPVITTDDSMSQLVTNVDVMYIQEGQATVISGIRIRDVDEDHLLEVILTSFHGVIAFTNVLKPQFSTTLTLACQVEDCNKILSTIVFKGDFGAGAAASMVVSVQDSKGSFDSLTLPISLLASSMPPVLLFPTIPFSCEEDDSVTIHGLRLDFPNYKAGEELGISLHATNGKVEFTASHDLVEVVSDGLFINATGTLKTLSEYFLSEFVYTPNHNFNTEFTEPDSIHILIRSSLGDVSAVIFVHVAAVNDVPSLQIPGAHMRYGIANRYVTDYIDPLAIEEDTKLLIDGIRITDADSEVGQFRLKLTASHGTVQVSSLDGIEYVELVNGVELIGGLERLNSALELVSYIGHRDWHGFDLLVIVVADPSSAEDKVEIPIEVLAVNDFPVWQVPSEVRGLLEDGAMLIPGVHLNDVDADGEMDIIVSANIGTLTMDGETRSEELSLHGSLNDLNSALSQLVYFPGVHMNTQTESSGTIHFIAKDGGSSGLGGERLSEAFISIFKIYPVNDPPRILVPGASFADSDTCQTDIGGASPGYVNDISVFKVCGNIVDVATIQGFEDEPLTIEGIYLVDVDSRMLTVAITVSHGALMIEGAATTMVSSNGDKSLTDPNTEIFFRCAVIHCNIALSKLVYIPDANWNGDDSLDIEATDVDSLADLHGLVSKDRQSIPIRILPVGDYPILDVSGNRYTIEEGETLRFTESSVAVIHRDSMDTEIVVICVALTGELSLNLIDIDIGVNFIPEVESLYRDQPLYSSLKNRSAIAFITTVTRANQILSHFSFSPTAYWNSNLAGWAHISFLAINADAFESQNDSSPFGEMPFDILNLTSDQFSTADIQIWVNPVNDPPSLKRSLSYWGTEEDTLMSLAGIQLYDVDSETVLLTFTSEYGSWHIDVKPDDVLVKVSQMTEHTGSIAGSPGAIQAWLDSDKLSYLPQRDWFGTDRITIVAVDDSHAAVELGFEVVITPVNDAPIVLLERNVGGEAVVRILEGESVALSSTIYDSLTNPMASSSKVFHLWRTQGQLPTRKSGSWRGTGEPESAWRWSDINNDIVSDPRFLVKVGDKVFFTAMSEAHGSEVWKSSGTKETMELIQDIQPGAQGSNPMHLHLHSDGLVYFSAKGTDLQWMQTDDECNGFKVISVSNTTVGLAVSSSSSYSPQTVYDCPESYHWASTRDMELLIGDADHPRYVTDALYTDQCGWSHNDWGGVTRHHFLFSDSFHTSMVLRSNHGMQMVKESIGLFAGIVCVANDYSECEDCIASSGQELWRTDGITATKVADVLRGNLGSYPEYLESIGNLLLFSARSPLLGAELFVLDTSSDTLQMVKDIYRGSVSSHPMYLTQDGNSRVFFSATDESHGNELWVTDGMAQYDMTSPSLFTLNQYTGEGTHMVLDIVPGVIGSDPKSLTQVSPGWIAFTASDSSGIRDIYVSDGDGQIGKLTTGLSDISDLIMYNGALYFVASDFAHGRELFAVGSGDSFTATSLSDGASTLAIGADPSPLAQRLVMDTVPGSPSGNPSQITVHTTSGTINDMEYLFFIVNGALWRHDGLSSERAFALTHPELSPDPFTHMVSVADMMLVSAVGKVNRPKRAGRSSLVQAFRVIDVDETGLLRLSLQCSLGLLNGEDSIAISGTAESLNQFLQNLTYVGRTGMHGMDKLEITITDSNEASSSKYINVFIDAVNHEPRVLFRTDVLSVSGTQTIGNRIDVEDDCEDASTGIIAAPVITIGLQVSSGTLRLLRTRDISIGHSDDYDILFTGTLHSANEALHSLEYACSCKGKECTDIRLAVYVNDNGNFGIGGAKYVTESLLINCAI